MRVELSQLLSRRPIAHPTRIVAATVARGSLQIVVQGNSWWSEASDNRSDHTIKLLFEGVTDGCLQAADLGSAENDSDEALELFEIMSLAVFDWAQPNSFSVYCSRPLKHPLNLYLRVHDFLKEVDSYREVSEFLNYPSGHLAQFVETASSNSFLVASGPQCILDIVRGELDAQSTTYNIVETKLKPDHRLLVRLADSHFLCSGAFAEFEE